MHVLVVAVVDRSLAVVVSLVAASRAPTPVVWGMSVFVCVWEGRERERVPAATVGQHTKQRYLSHPLIRQLLRFTRSIHFARPSYCGTHCLR